MVCREGYYSRGRPAQGHKYSRKHYTYTCSCRFCLLLLSYKGRSRSRGGAAPNQMVVGIGHYLFFIKDFRICNLTNKNSVGADIKLLYHIGFNVSYSIIENYRGACLTELIVNTCELIDILP